MNLTLYKSEIRVTSKSVLTGDTVSMVHFADKMFTIPILKEFIEDDEIQEITVCSSNIGFVKTYRKFYAERGH